MVGLLRIVGEPLATFAFLKCFASNLSASNCALYLLAVVVINKYFPSSFVFLVGSRPESKVR